MGTREEGEKLSGPVPCNLMGPSLSFPGEISKRQNSRDRILFMIKRNHFLQDVLALCSHFFLFWELLHPDKHNHSSALFSCPPLWNANEHLLRFPFAPGDVLSNFICIAHALHTVSPLVLMAALCSGYFYPFTFLIEELRLGEVKQHIQVIEPGLKPGFVTQLMVTPATQLLRPRSEWSLISFFPSPSYPLSQQVLWTLSPTYVPDLATFFFFFCLHNASFVYSHMGPCLEHCSSLLSCSSCFHSSSWCWNDILKIKLDPIISLFKTPTDCPILIRKI